MAALALVLADIRAFLAPTGVAIFTTPNNEDLAKNMLLCPATGEIFHRWQHVRSWNRDTLPTRLSAAGFKPMQVIETNMAIARPKGPVEFLKQIAKRTLLGKPDKPHLVCVASAATT